MACHGPVPRRPTPRRHRGAAPGAPQDRPALPPRRLAAARDHPRSRRAAGRAARRPTRRRGSPAPSTMGEICALAGGLPRGLRRHPGRAADRGGALPAPPTSWPSTARARERALPGGALLAGAPHPARPQAHHHRRRGARRAPRARSARPASSRTSSSAASATSTRRPRSGWPSSRSPTRTRASSASTSPAPRRTTRPSTTRRRSSSSSTTTSTDHPRRRGLRPRVDRPGGPRLRRPPHRPRRAAARERRPAQLRQRPPHPARDVPVVQRADRRGDRPREPPAQLLLRLRAAGDGQHRQPAHHRHHLHEGAARSPTARWASRSRTSCTARRPGLQERLPALPREGRPARAGEPRRSPRCVARFAAADADGARMTARRPLPRPRSARSRRGERRGRVRHPLRRARARPARPISALARGTTSRRRWRRSPTTSPGRPPRLPPLDLRGTPFQRAGLAGAAGHPLRRGAHLRRDGRRASAAPGRRRAVGGANHANPVAILVPCHRVVAAGGRLGGYGGGLDVKRLAAGARGGSRAGAPARPLTAASPQPRHAPYGGRQRVGALVHASRRLARKGRDE